MSHLFTWNENFEDGRTSEYTIDLRDVYYVNCPYLADYNRSFLVKMRFNKDNVNIPNTHYEVFMEMWGKVR